MIEFDGNNFDRVINDSKVVVDFYADWCGPCRMLGPIVEEVCKENNIKLIKVNVDHNPEIAKRYGVMSIPTIILFKNGEEKNKNIGFIPKEQIEEFIK